LDRNWFKVTIRQYVQIMMRKERTENWSNVMKIAVSELHHKQHRWLALVFHGPLQHSIALPILYCWHLCRFHCMPCSPIQITAGCESWHMRPRLLTYHPVKLDAIPTVGLTGLGPITYYLGAINYIFNANSLIQRGYDKVCPSTLLTRSEWFWSLSSTKVLHSSLLESIDGLFSSVVPS